MTVWCFSSACPAFRFTVFIPFDWTAGIALWKRDGLSRTGEGEEFFKLSHPLSTGRRFSQRARFDSTDFGKPGQNEKDFAPFCTHACNASRSCNRESLKHGTDTVRLGLIAALSKMRSMQAVPLFQLGGSSKKRDGEALDERTHRAE